MRDRRRTTLRALSWAALALAPVLLGAAGAAEAHPLDVYLQSTYISVGGGQVEVELDLSPGVLIAPGMLPTLDTDDNHRISAAEGRAYAAVVLDRLVLRVDGVPLTPRVTSIDMPPYVTLQAGYGTIRVFTTATGAVRSVGNHHVFVRNGFAPTGSAYQVNAFVAKGAAITLGTQHRDSTQQQSLVDYRITQVGTAGETGPASHAPASQATSRSRSLFDILQRRSLSVWVIIAALGLAGLLGALHALTPGHGKTLMAAYLVGSAGTARNAITLGAVVTFTHTASVIAIGMVALVAGQFIVPGVLVPALEITAGLLVVACGIRLVVQRWRTRTASETTHTHAHEHVHDHVHDHGDGRPHSHAPQPTPITARSLVALGVSGGLVPCPEALGVMILAVGVNRIALGMGLIVSFSIGLATVLIGLGLLLVRSRSLVGRWSRGRQSRVARALPLVSAVIVTVLGVVLVLRGVGSHLPLLA